MHLNQTNNELLLLASCKLHLLLALGTMHLAMNSVCVFLLLSLSLQFAFMCVIYVLLKCYKRYRKIGKIHTPNRVFFLYCFGIARATKCIMCAKGGPHSIEDVEKKQDRFFSSFFLRI